MIGCDPVDPGAVGDEQLLGAQQLDDERLVVLDLVDLGVEPRKDVERAVRLDARDAGDVVEEPPGELALVVESPARDE